jgi:hypothetical protein
VLNIDREAGRDTVRIIDGGIQTVRLEEHLMALFVAEPVDLVFYRRAVAWPNALDDPGKQRRTV